MSAHFWNEDDENAHRAFILESARIEERSALRAAYRRGFEKGFENGLKIGRRESAAKTVLKMIQNGRFDDALIAQVTGLSEEEVRQLRAQA